MKRNNDLKIDVDMPSDVRILILVACEPSGGLAERLNALASKASGRRETSPEFESRSLRSAHIDTFDNRIKQIHSAV